MLPKKTLFIVNPVAARGKLKAKWALVEEELKKYPHASFKWTQKPGHGTELTQHALKSGMELIVSVGGDGTLNECINGFFLNGKAINPKAGLGIMSLGRGGDFARFMQMPRDPLESFKHLVQAKVRPVDLAHMTCVGKNGKPLSKYYINIGSAGIVAHVDNWANKLPPFLGSKLTYLYSTLRSVIEYRPREVIFESKEKSGKCQIMMLIAANGRHFGAGMSPAPKAIIDDGLLDIVIVKPAPIVRTVKDFPKFYAGKHLDSSDVEYFRTKKLMVQPSSKEKKSVLVEIDGDTVGTLPAQFEILPGAIRLKG